MGIALLLRRCTQAFTAGFPSPASSGLRGSTASTEVAPSLVMPESRCSKRWNVPLSSGSKVGDWGTGGILPKCCCRASVPGVVVSSR